MPQPAAPSPKQSKTAGAELSSAGWEPGRKLDDVQIEFYREHGEWARHYSTVRMTLGTFFITLALGIIQFRWETPSVMDFIIVGFVILVGFGIFVIFTRETIKSLNSQLRIVNSFKNAQGQSALARLRRALLQISSDPEMAQNQEVDLAGKPGLRAELSAALEALTEIRGSMDESRQVFDALVAARSDNTKPFLIKQAHIDEVNEHLRQLSESGDPIRAVRFAQFAAGLPGVVVFLLLVAVTVLWAFWPALRGFE